MNPEIDFVTLLGQAGTGKTLLTLAAALTQTLEQKRFSEIIITRVTVPVGEDIGFLPGTEEEKMTPWMGALEDNLDVLNKPAETSGPAGAGNICVTPPTRDSGTSGGFDSQNYGRLPLPGKGSGAYYRIVVRVVGARNTTSFVETVVYR